MADDSTPTRSRVRHSVSPEIAANVREEDEALAAVVMTAQAIATAAAAAANAQIAAAQARHRAAMRPIFRQLNIVGDATIVATDGTGNKSVLIIEVPAAQARRARNA